MEKKNNSEGEQEGHEAYLRLRSMLAARSNSFAVGSAKSRALAYRVTMLNIAPTAIASFRPSALTPASNTAAALLDVSSVGRNVIASRNSNVALRPSEIGAAR